MNDNNLLRESLEVQVPMLGRHQWVSDVPRRGAAKMYRQNWDGCRDLWKQSYRQRKDQRG